jgi:hypothetical protein
LTVKSCRIAGISHLDRLLCEQSRPEAQCLEEDSSIPIEAEIMVSTSVGAGRCYSHNRYLGALSPPACGHVEGFWSVSSVLSLGPYFIVTGMIGIAIWRFRDVIKLKPNSKQREEIYDVIVEWTQHTARGGIITDKGVLAPRIYPLTQEPPFFAGEVRSHPTIQQLIPKSYPTVHMN